MSTPMLTVASGSRASETRCNGERAVSVGVGVLLAVLMVVATIDQVTAFLAYPNSDWLAMFDVANNVREYGSLLGQDLPVAPYFFPDMLVLFLVRTMSGSVSVATGFWFVLFAVVTIYTVTQLLQSVQVARPLAVLLACAVLLTLALVPRFGIERIDLPVRQHYYPDFLKNLHSSHMTAAAVSLIGLLLYVRTVPYRTRHLSVAALAGLLVLALLCFESNSLLFFYLSCPLLVILGLDVAFRVVTPRTALTVAAVVVVPFAVTFFGRSWIDARLGATLTFSQTMLVGPWTPAIAIRGIAGFFEALVLAATGQPFLYATIAVCEIVLVIAWLDALIIASRDGTYSGNLARIYSFLLLSQLFAIAVCVVVNRLYLPDLFRYIVPSYLYPLIGTAMFVGRAAQRLAVSRWLPSVLLLPPLAGAVGLVLGDMPRLQTLQIADPYPIWVQCVDEAVASYHIKNGLVGYWDIRPLRMFSRTGVSPALIDGSMAFFPLADNVHSLFDGRGAPLTFDFVLANGLNGGVPREAVVTAVGAPTAVVRCPDYQMIDADFVQPGPEVLVYAGSQRDVLNTFMRGRLTALAASNRPVRELWRTDVSASALDAIAVR